MASLWFLKLALKCFDHLAWPLLALGYPMYASVQAIETDSYTETRNLNSYWILLSLINLFEYAFMRLLQWFQFWPYIKLMIIFWLIIPDFGQASYVYNNLICSCISMKPQTVIFRLNNWKKFCVKKENFLQQAERYVKENGTEALEKLIASKNTTYKPDTKATTAIRATDNKEMQQTDGKRLQTEHIDIKDLEVIEKKEIPTAKQDIPVMPNLEPSQNTFSATVETKGIAGKDTAGGELPQSSTHKEVQKEWTGALCQLTTTSENNLNSHLHGMKHRAAYEALKAKNQPTPQKMKIYLSKEELKQKNISNQMDSNAKNGEITVNNGLKGIGVMDHKKVQELQKNQSKPVRMNNFKLKCEVCNIIVPGEVDMASHLKGRKHRAAYEALKAKNQLTPQKMKIYQFKDEWKQKNISNQLNSNANGLKGIGVMDHKLSINENTLTGFITSMKVEDFESRNLPPIRIGTL